MKRVYKQVATDGIRVFLDGRPVRTPARAELELPTPALAAAVAAEWDAQATTIDPVAMPLMQLAATAIDRVMPAREQILAATLRYAETDLVCYRAEEPVDLARRQQAAWQPLLDWLDRRYNVRLLVASGVMPTTQDAAALERLALWVAQFDDWRLTALQSAAAATGSLVVALALTAGRLGAAQAFAVAELDESFQIERWGEDPIATQRRQSLAAELDAVRRFLDLLEDAAPVGRA